MNQVPLLIACFSLEGRNICKIASVPLTLQVSMCLTTCIKIVHTLSCEPEAGGKTVFTLLLRVSAHKTLCYSSQIDARNLGMLPDACNINVVARHREWVAEQGKRTC